MNLWLITYSSLDLIPEHERRDKRILIHATSQSDAWDQARWRLGDTRHVVSVKPLIEESS